MLIYSLLNKIYMKKYSFYKGYKNMKDILKGTNLSLSNMLDIDTSSTTVASVDETIPSAEATQELLLSMEANKEKKNKDFINNLQNFSKKVGSNPNNQEDNLDIEDNGNPQSKNKNPNGQQKQSELPPQQQPNGDPNDPNNQPPQQPANGDPNDPNNQPSNNQEGGPAGNSDPNDPNNTPAEGDPNDPNNQPQEGDPNAPEGDPNDPNNQPQEGENPIAMSDDSIVNIELDRINNILDKELGELKDAVKIVKGMKKNIESNMTVNAEQVSQAQAECETFRAYFGLPNFFDNIYLVTEDDINDTPLLTYRLVYKQFINSIRIVLSDYMDSK